MGNLLLCGSKKIDSMSNLTLDELLSKGCGEISYKIGSDWYRWGRHLGLSDSDLDNIDADYKKCFEKADNVLKKWKQINGYFTWEELKKQLKAFNRYDIIVEIEQKFQDYVSGSEKTRYEVEKIPTNSYENMALDLSKQETEKIKADTPVISRALKNYYLTNYRKINEIQPPLKILASVDLMHKFVDLCIVDAVNTQMDAVCSVERKEFLKRQMSYTPIPYSELFMKEKSVMLISGIAGIGKTWLLRKCLLDWSNDLIWENFELVFYLECRRLNQYQNISSINELLNIFYQDILNDFNISNYTVLFIIDGLDEFKYLNELTNPSLSCNYPIVNALREIQKHKFVVAGRIFAIDQYQNISTEHNDKLTIQVMGFNENGIKHYIENNVMEQKKVEVKAILNESPIAKAMASIPFYLSSMCKLISGFKKLSKNSFLTMTDLYANIFLYFLQKHIIKNNKMIHEIMDDVSNKKYLLDICKIAYQLFVENKVIFSKEEIQYFISDLDQYDGKHFGFIEKIETNLGYHYQFAHLTIMEFCASVYAYNCLSSEEILAEKKLESCLSMICGLTNESQNNVTKFLANLNPDKNFSDKTVLLFSIFDFLRKNYDNYNLFIECFYESQTSFTDQIKSFIDNQEWWISINDGKTSYETSCDNYFVNHYIKSGRMLVELIVRKNILSWEEKYLLSQCSTNVGRVYFDQPINFKGWKPINQIKWLAINISNYVIPKKDFEENFLPWINLCEELDLFLHNDIDFIKDVIEWILFSNVKVLWIEYCEKEFHNLDELKNFIT